jgi:hypothetical protein
MPPADTRPKSDRGTQVFSGVSGASLGGYLIWRRDVFVERIHPGGVERRTLGYARSMLMTSSRCRRQSKSGAVLPMVADTPHMSMGISAPVTSSRI